VTSKENPMGAGQARANKFKGVCADCGGDVPAQQGTLGREGDKWIVRHRDGGCGNAAQPAPVEFAPTAEQSEALALFARGESMVIEAGAGTGKTSTLKLLAESTTRTGQYIAFNKAIVDESAAKFPANVACNTAHSLAFRAVGKTYSHRMNTGRQTSTQIAAILRIDPVTVTVAGVERKTLAAGFLAGRVMQAVSRFCQSADDEPTRRHFPYIDGIDLPDDNGHRTFANNDEVAARMMPAVQRAWADLQNREGALRFGHDHYLKLWQLSGPKINAEFILFDEAQDANPVMAAIVAAQTHAQVVYVGDSQQAIYEFTGAVNALQNIDSEHRVFLTQSFRFGEAIAAAANEVLAKLDADLRLIGTDTIDSVVGLMDREDAVLCRTNALAVETVLNFQENGRRPFLVGGGLEVIRFAKGARDLMAQGHTDHPELACFGSWEDVERYVQDDAQGGDLKLMVSLVNKFGIPTILAALDSMPAEADADVVVSTAHKAKGREWDRVRIGADFPVEADKVGPAELRLIYVAVTRAKLALDMSSLAELFPPAEDEDGDDEVDDRRTRWVDGIED
jgi:hypothetical protein